MKRSSKAVHRLSRRSFLSDIGGGTVAVAVFGLAACSTPESEGSANAGTTTPGTVGTAPELEPGQSESGQTTSDAEVTPTVTAPAGPLAWERVNLGFVSAYVLARGSELAIVDTGTSGSEGEILRAVEALGGTWSDVNHVVATHAHGDHVGSIAEVMAAAGQSTGYAGVDDLGAINAGRDLVGLRDGDEVFGMRIVSSPGHTAGSISVFDEASGLLIAGDALNVEAGAVTGPNPGFSADVDLGNMSVQRLAELQFETLLVGHGEPVVGGAGEAVVALAASL